MLDKTDLKIVSILQCNGRKSNADIAREIGMAPSAVLERIRKLEDKGVIRGYHADIDPRAVDLGVLAFIFVRAERSYSETSRDLAGIPEALAVHHIAGEDCYIVKVRAKDTEELGKLLEHRINGSDSVRSTKTTIVFATIKDLQKLPID